MKDTTEMEAGPRGLPPSHPGHLLRTVTVPALQDAGITIETFAEVLGMSRQNLHAILQEKRSVTPEVALRLAAYVGSTPKVWMAMQSEYDLWQAAQTIDVSHIQPAAVGAEAGEAG